MSIYTIEDTDVSTGITTVVVYNSQTGTVTTSIDGTQTKQRSMTSAETSQVEMHEQAKTSAVNTTQMVTESDESVDKLVAVVEALNAITSLTNATINANPAAIIKDLARECKTIARQVNREARMTSGRTESTDTGPGIEI